MQRHLWVIAYVRFNDETAYKTITVQKVISCRRMIDGVNKKCVHIVSK